MTEADIDAAHALTQSFGWPYRREDWAFFLALGEGVVAERAGQVAGTALCWRHGADWATVGLITVAAELQGQGMGRRMMRGLMEGLAGRTILLHATEAGQPLYASLGFVPTGTIVQHQGAVVAGAGGQQGLRPVVRADLDGLAALDRAGCGMDRRPLLAALLDIGEGVVLDDGAGPAGFALVRRFGRGEVIGPVIAADFLDARAMIGALLAPRTGRFVRLDVPAASGLGPWLEGRGLAAVDRPVRMVFGADAMPGPVRSFALVSQSLG
jgi:GNAT superfamily N-acetyltransferase